MISESLRKIERELDALADSAPIDAHAVRVIARKIGVPVRDAGTGAERVIRFTVPGLPQGKGRARFGNGRTYTPAKTVAYEGLIALAAQQAMAGADLIAGPVYLTVTAFFPIPASWSKRRKAESNARLTWHTSKPDADNIAKAAGDALNGVVFKDDSQVAFAKVMKHYAETPRLEIVVEALV